MRSNVKQAIWAAVQATITETLDATADRDISIAEVWEISMAGIRAGIKEADVQYKHVGQVMGKTMRQVHDLVDLIDNQVTSIGEFMNWEHPIAKW